MTDLPRLLAALDAERRRRQRVRFHHAGPQINYTWRRVAREAGVHPTALSHLRTGRRQATDETVARLLAWLGRDLSAYVTTAEER